jgi:hypothetical protein
MNMIRRLAEHSILAGMLIVSKKIQRENVTRMKPSFSKNAKIDELGNRWISDGFVKGSRSRLANPENTAIAGAVGSVLIVRRSDEGKSATQISDF